MMITSVFMMAFVAIAVAILVYFMTIKINRPIKYVDLLRPRDGRGTTLKVVKETDLGLECKKTGGITHSFLKIGRGWTFNKRGRMITRFFGLEVTPYTARVDGPITEKISQEDYLRTLWTDQIYDALPDELRKKIEKDKLGVTLEVSRAEEMQELPEVSSDNIATEEEENMLRRLARMTADADEKPKMSILTMGGLVCLGAFIMYFLMTRGII